MQKPVIDSTHQIVTQRRLLRADFLSFVEKGAYSQVAAGVYGKLCKYPSPI